MCVYVCVHVAGTRMQRSIPFSLVSYISSFSKAASGAEFCRGQLHCLQGSNTRAQILLQVIQQMEFIVLSRLRYPYTVSLLRVDL